MKRPLYIVTLLIVFGMMVDYRFLSGVEGVPSATLVEGLCSVAVLLLFAQLALAGDELASRITSVHRNNRLVAWYFIWAGLASVASLIRSTDALRVYKDLLPSLVAYIVISVCVDSRRTIKGALVAFMSGSVLILVVGVSQFLTGVPRVVELGGTAASKVDFWGRSAGENVATGFFLHPNGYAISLLPLIVLIVGLLLQKGTTRPAHKVVLVLVLLLAILNLAGTYAKGVIVWVVVGIGLLLLVLRMRRSRTIAAVVILVTLIAVITMYGIGALGEIGPQYGTMVTRLQLWKAGIEEITGDPFVLFLGNGFSGMITTSALYSNVIYPNAHNTYINQVIYFGLPALVLYVGLSARALRQAARLMQTSDRNQRIAAGVLFSTIAALLGIFFFEPANEGVVLQAEFFALLAFANSLGIESRETAHAGKLDIRKA
jgi:O-antigen ligase